MVSDGREETIEPGPTTTEEIDDGVDGLLDLEADVGDLPGAAAGLDEERAVGTITDVRRIPASRVPDVYPVAIGGDRAIAFTVNIDGGRETTVYLEWPERYDESADLAHLLAELDVSPQRFGDVLGEDVPLKVVEGQWVPDVRDGLGERESRDGERGRRDDDRGAGEVVMDDDTVQLRRTRDGLEVSRSDDGLGVLRGDDNPWYVGVLLCTLFWAQLLASPFLSLPVPALVQALGVLATTFVFPVAMYLDAKHVEANSDWSPMAVLWAVGAFVWLINLFVALAYINKRRYAMRER